MRNALSVAICLALLPCVRGDAQSLNSFNETVYHTPEGFLLGMPGLEAPVFKNAPLPVDIPRRPGRLPDAVDVLVKIDREGRVKPSRVVGINGDSVGLSVTQATRAKVFALLETWAFEPGRQKSKPVDVAAVLSVPFATDHVQTAEHGESLPADFAPAVPSSRQEGILPPYSRMTAPPQYGSPAAMQALISGTVEIAFVVDPDGHVGATRITKSLDAHFGLDALSLSSLKSWVFQPAFLDGKPVATKQVAVMSFILK